MTVHKPLMAVALLAALCVVSPRDLLAQGRQTSTLEGTVRDTSAAVLPGVAVTVSSPTNVGGAQTATTDAQGQYRFTNLQPGEYELLAELSGFKTLRRTQIRLPVGTTITLDVNLEVATVEETVTVTGASPVVDVNNNPSNPVINTRSFGEDPQRVARLSAQFVKGTQDGGAISTAKHFPGHGDTDVDSHVGLPIVDATWTRLDTLELVPFRAAIDAGAGMVMTAHIALPAVEGDSTTPAHSARTHETRCTSSDER